MMAHLSDEKAAQLLDRALTEGDAQEARAHVARCPECQARVTAMEELTLRLSVAPAPSDNVVRGVLSRVNTPRPPRVTGVVLLPLLATAAAGLALLLVPRAPDDEGMVARGAPTAVAPVHLKAYHWRDTTPERLADGDGASTPLRLSVTLGVMPQPDATHAAVYARDAQGRVTWLMPSWTDPASVPGCVALPTSGGELAAPQVVELAEVATGTLEIVALAGKGACRIPELDSQLEKTGAVQGAETSVAERVRIQVR